MLFGSLLLVFVENSVREILRLKDPSLSKRLLSLGKAIKFGFSKTNLIFFLTKKISLHRFRLFTNAVVPLDLFLSFVV